MENVLRGQRRHWENDLDQNVPVLNVHRNVLIMKVTRSRKEFSLCGHVSPSAPPPQSLWEVYLGANPDSFWLISYFVWNGQAAAETAYDMVSPGPLCIEPKKSRRFPHHRLAHQPVDLREGVAKAYSVVKEVGGPRWDKQHYSRASWLSSQSIQWLSFIPGSGLGAAPSNGCKCVRWVRTGRVDWWTPRRAVIQWRDGPSFPADASELDRHQTLINWVQCMMILCCICLRSV